MTDLKQDICDSLKKNRENISESSCKTYASLLSSMYKKIGLFNGIESFTKDKKQIVEHIKTLDKPQSRKTILSGLIVITDLQEYKDLMKDNTKIVNDHYKNQKIDPEKLENMKSFEEIKSIHNEYRLRLKAVQTSDRYMDLLIVALFSGVIDGLPPRRLQDWTEMKKLVEGVDVNKEIDNYVDMKKNIFVFNKYKTADQYGKQIIDIPAELRPLIKVVAKFEGEYLLSNSGEKYSTSAMSKKLTKMFGVSVDGLRAIFLSNLYKDMPKLKGLSDTAEQMGHDVATAISYYVKPQLQDMNK